MYYKADGKTCEVFKTLQVWLDYAVSGFPGSPFTCSLYLDPFLCRNLRTSNSGLVSLLRMRDML